MFKDVAVGTEDAVGEPVVADELPDILDRIEFGAFGRQRDERDVRRHDEPERAGCQRPPARSPLAAGSPAEFGPGTVLVMNGVFLAACLES